MPAAGALDPLVGAKGSERRRIVSNGTWTTGVFLANAVVVFLLSPFVRRSLGDGGYGMWELVLSLTGYFGFADLGIKPAAVWFVARHDARGEPGEVNRYANVACAVFAGAGGLVLLVALGCAPFFASWFGLVGAAADDARTALLVTSASIAVTLPLHAYSAVAIGKQRYRGICATDLVVLCAKAAATVVVLRAGGGIVGLALVAAAADVVEMAWKARLGFLAEPALRLRPRWRDAPAAKGLLAFGLAAILVNLAQLLVWRTDALVIGAALGAEAITVFAVGSKLPFYARSLANAASRVLAPAATKVEATGSPADLVPMLSRASGAMLLVSGAMIAFLVGVGAPFLGTWQGDEFRGDAFVVMAILGIGALGPIAAQPFEHVLYGARRIVPLAWISLAEGAANLATSLALVRPLGVVGVALGTAIPGLLVRLVVLPAYGVRAFGGRFGSFAVRAWTVPLLATAATSALLLALVPRSASFGWTALLGLAAATQAVHLGFAWVLSKLAPKAWRTPTSAAEAPA